MFANKKTMAQQQTMKQGATKMRTTHAFTCKNMTTDI